MSNESCGKIILWQKKAPVAAAVKNDLSTELTPSTYAEPKQPEMTRLASKYPRFFKIYNELEQQNNAIYKTEKQRSAKKKELSEIKGWFKGRKKKELQEEIDNLTSQIRNMKDYLPKIVQKVGYRNVQEFLKDFKIAKSEYSQYQKAIARWQKRIPGGRSLHRRTPHSLMP